MSISIIVPVRKGGDPKTTLDSLAKQTYQDFCVTISHDVTPRGNSNKTRNSGFDVAPKMKYTLFSDDDIDWKPNALQLLVNTLQSHPKKAYSYGAYSMGGQNHCQEHWRPGHLWNANYISTMSLVRTECLPVPPFDEDLFRLQDWDLWLRMLKGGHEGVYCDEVIFTTEVRPGITFGGNTDPKKARKYIMAKHGRRPSGRPQESP